MRMHIKYIFQGLLALVVISAGMSLFKADLIRQWPAPSQAKAAAIQFQNDAPTADALLVEAAPPAPLVDPIQPDANKRGLGGMRKCKKGATVVYTDRPCPEGAQRKTIEGTMTVVKGVPQGF
ncbi:MAG: hypothetical protein EOP40_02605 [Rubrivivax sp.]|nr:MAG: hypothetical protein EOP40_02605 [Rubrivivax sp.]